MLRPAILAALAALAALPASAGPRHMLAMARVEVGDLDLSSDAGAAAMLRRLSSAASELCEQPRSPLLPRSQAFAWRCRRDAVAAAVDRFKTPAMTVAYHAWLSAGPAPSP